MQEPKQRPVKISFLQDRIHSFKYAFRGLNLLVRNEKHIQIHLVNTLCAIALFAWLNISALEWMLISITLSIVFIAEGLNTAIEKLSDAVTEEYSEKIRLTKDISAGASIIASFNALIVGSIVLVNNLL